MRVQCKTQNTAEWFAARCGKVTASKIADAAARLSKKSKNGEKGDWAAAHTTYVSQLALELVTRTPGEHYVSKPMEIGAQYEGEARIEYWMRYGTDVDETGFVLHPALDWLGASPDGLVGIDGGIEIKVPLLETHWGYLIDDEIPRNYQMQMQCGMLCCEREWWDFVSYCPPDIAPELPDEFRMFCKRLHADESVFIEIEEAATRTIEEAAAMVELLRKKYPRVEYVNARPVKQQDDYTAEEVSDFTGDAYAFVDDISLTP